MPSIPSVESLTCSGYQGQRDLIKLHEIAKRPHRIVQEPHFVSLSSFSETKILETAPQGVDIGVSFACLGAAGPKTKQVLEANEERYREWGLDVSMKQEGEDWVIEARPQEEKEPIILGSCVSRYNIDRTNPLISSDAFSALVALLLLSPQDDPDIYKRVREDGFVVIYHQKQEEQDIEVLGLLVIPGQRAKAIGLVGKEADDQRLYPFSSRIVSEAVYGRETEVGNLFGNPVAIIATERF